MNKYHKVLDKILQSGEWQNNKKGKIQFLTNHLLKLKPVDLLEILEGHAVARNKLKTELSLFMKGERSVKAYNEAGIN